MGVKKGYLYPESTYNGTEGTGDNIEADGAGNREQNGGEGDLADGLTILPARNSGGWRKFYGRDAPPHPHLRVLQIRCSK